MRNKSRIAILSVVAWVAAGTAIGLGLMGQYGDCGIFVIVSLMFQQQIDNLTKEAK